MNDDMSNFIQLQKIKLVLLTLLILNTDHTLMLSNRRIGPVMFNDSCIIGQGNTGNVFKGKLINTYSQSAGNNKKLNNKDIEVAVKVVPLQTAFQNQVTQYLFHSEKLALISIKNDYIIKCYGIFQDSVNSYITTQFLPAGTLKQYLHTVKYNKLPQNIALDITLKLLKALKVICESGFVHRDLKSANVMLKKRQNSQFMDPIIIDFGFAQNNKATKQPSIFYNVGSPSYMSPQSFNWTRYSQKSDLWSIGVIFYQMLTGQLLDKNLMINDFFANADHIVQQKIQKLKPFLSKTTCKILQLMLKSVEIQRGSVEQTIKLVQNCLSEIKSQFFSLKNKIPVKIQEKYKTQHPVTERKQKPKFNSKTFFKPKNNQNQVVKSKQMISSNRFSNFTQKKHLSNTQLRNIQYFKQLENKPKMNLFTLQNPQSKQLNKSKISNSSLNKSMVQFKYTEAKIPKTMSQTYFYVRAK